MSPERLTRLSITIFVVVVLGMLLAVFFTSDNAATQRCIDKGYSPEECGWR